MGKYTASEALIFLHTFKLNKGRCDVILKGREICEDNVSRMRRMGFGKRRKRKITRQTVGL